MLKTYVRTIEESACSGLVDGAPDVVIVHDPQPMGLASYVRAMDSVADRESAIWLWRCHIDIEEASLAAHPQLWDFANRWVKSYDAGIFTAAQYVVSQWPTPKFIIPPFIDPLSDKNRPLERGFIDGVLAKYGIDDDIPIILQIGRFDPWKGLDRTITTYRRVRQEVRCQLVLAGGLASDDPEGQRVLDRIQDMTKDDQGIHVLLLSLEDRLSNYLEVNALQSAASVIMQPSTREGFGLVVTEGLWKAKPVIGADVGAIPIQIRDGHTGLFFTTARNTAKKVVGLLSNPKAAKEMGEEARRYVQDHFLLPDRLADYLAAIDMLVNPGRGHALPAESIISFHPWFPLRSHR
jgi:trehalose synthase